MNNPMEPAPCPSGCSPVLLPSTRMLKPDAQSQLAKDFRIFLEPGLWAAVILNLLLVGAIAGALLYGDMRYGIPPF